ncbi:MAG TPA: PAS domain-containing protein [Marmoricola sp.]
MVGTGDMHRLVVESSLDGIWVVDESAHTVFANARVGQLLGRSELDLAGLAITDVLVDADRRGFTDRLAALVRGAADRRSVERTFVRADGGTVSLVVSDRVLHDDAGNVAGFLHQLTDDGRRRSLVAELSRSRSQLAEGQSIARLGSWEVQLEPRQITWSDQMFELLGVDPETHEVTPEGFVGRAVPQDRDRLRETWARFEQALGELTVDARFETGAGAPRWMRIVGRVVERDAAGRPVRFGGTMQDIDDLKRADHQLRETVKMNTLMQFMATAANETSTLDTALARLRKLLLADDDWLRGIAFTVAGNDLAWRRVGGDDVDPPTPVEHDVAVRALASAAPVFEEDALPDKLVIGFPVSSRGAAVVVAVVTAQGSFAQRPVIGSLVRQVAGQLAQVAEREALVDELSRSRSQLAEAQAIAGVGSWEMQAEPPYHSTCSDQFYAVLDVDPEVWTPGLDAFLGQLTEEDREPLLEAYSRAVSEPGEHMVDVRAVMQDGTLRWLRTVGQVLEWAPDGTPVRLGGTVQDIHDVKQTEFRLRDAVELNTLMQVLASAANETNTLDEAFARTRDLLLAHPDWARGVAFDVTDDGLVFRPVTPGDDMMPTALELSVAERAYAEAGIVFEEDAVPRQPMIGFPLCRDGEPVVVAVITARSPFERHAMMRSLVGQVADQLAQVASREATANELAAARDLAMAASQAKSEFLATMSHEIRTPLNGVIGLNDLLLRTDLDVQQRQFAEAMQNAGRSLLVLISDILDFSKIEAGGIELEAVSFRPEVVVQGTLELFVPLAESKGIELLVELDPDVPERLEGDPGRFGQILSNLVANAVKFTHQGQVRVEVSATTVRDRTTLRVEVHDTGIGMDDEQLSRIFQPFRQADASTTRTFGGTGLGLAIAHRLSAALGGEIGVSSQLDVGSTFWFTGVFRVAAAATPGTPHRAMPLVSPRTGGHVLVVEDNEVNQLVAVGMLEVLGYTSEVAADGAAAAARAAGGRFDAVLMDLQMPRLDGYAATRLIREAESPEARVPIIALTASATAGEQERCLQAGMTGFLSKPVSVEALGRVLAEQLGDAGAPAEPPAAVACEPVVEPAPPSAQPPVLDARRLEDLVEMGSAAVPLVQRAIDNFVAAVEDHVEALRAALAASDASAVRAVAHRVKGSAANLGAARVADLALELELLADTGELDGAPRLVGDLAAALASASSALTAHRLVAGDEDAAYSV